MDWRSARTIQLKQNRKVLYECKGIWRGNMLYFPAEFTINEPVTMVLLDDEERIVGVEHLPSVKGKFGPGVINHSIFRSKPNADRS